MQEVSQALLEVKDLFQKVVGQPAPQIGPSDYWAFPPGVDPVAHTIQEVEHLKHLAEQVASVPTPAAWVPRADSFFAEDMFVILVELPGVARDDLKVLVVGNECVVRGERKRPEEITQLRPMTLESPWGTFERRFPLPIGALHDQLTATYEEGVLQLKILCEKAVLPKETPIDVTWTPPARTAPKEKKVTRAQEEKK